MTYNFASKQDIMFQLYYDLSNFKKVLSGGIDAFPVRAKITNLSKTRRGLFAYQVTDYF